MRLTSYNRVLIALSNGELALKDNLQHKRRFLTLISSVSNRVENFLNRTLELKSYTEFRDSLPNTVEYFLQGVPITSITSVHEDNTGLFSGSETAETDFYIGKEFTSIVLDSPVVPAKKGLRFIYTGGLAVSGVQSTYVLSSEGSPALVKDNFVIGGDSLTQGKVVSKTGTTIVIEVLYGVFEVGEIIQGHTSEGTNDIISGATATLDSVTTLSLAESFPDIVEATELEIRYMDDHKSDFENVATSKAGTSRGSLLNRDSDRAEYDLLPEVRSLLTPHRNITL